MLRIGLAPCRFVNRDMAFNLSRMEKTMEAQRGKVDLLCFGETFLQGFDALSWDYETDRKIAVAADSDVMRRLADKTLEYGVDLLFGYLEDGEDGIYSSCAVLERGKLIHNYRRISKGWKEPWANARYREGTETAGFSYRGRHFQLALCGDLWEEPRRFQGENLIWPIYVNFPLEQWEEEEAAYAAQAGLAARRTLMVNSISENPEAHGGAFCFEDGKTAGRTPFDSEEVLIVRL